MVENDRRAPQPRIGTGLGESDLSFGNHAVYRELTVIILKIDKSRTTQWKCRCSPPRCNEGETAGKLFLLPPSDKVFRASNSITRDDQ
jgi:hypothetical protein